MMRLRAFLIVAAALMLPGSPAMPAAGNSAFDGLWTATFRAEGADSEYCQIAQMWGEVVIRDGSVLVSTEQNGVTHRLQGSIDGNGNFAARGDWQPGTNSNISVAIRNYTLRGKIRNGKIVGTFHGGSAQGGGSACYALVSIAYAAPLPAAVSMASIAGSLTGSLFRRWSPPAPVRTVTAPSRAATAAETAPEQVAAVAVASPEPVPPPEPAQIAAAPLAPFQPPAPPAQVRRAQRIVAAGAIPDMVAYVNGEGGLSLVQQRTLFKKLKGPEIAKRLKASEDSAARQVGETLEEVVKGKPVDQRQMKARLGTLGIQGPEALTYLALYDRARKHSRTELYGSALKELKRRPPIVEIVVPAPSVQRRAPTGRRRRVALLISAQNYQAPIPDLKTPIADVEAIGRRLRNRFGYETKILRDATKRQIVTELQNLVNTLDANDSVVIMYAGHGYIHEPTGVGYWLPVDASTGSAKAWISNTDLSAILKAIPSRRIMLIADSCYSGSLLGKKADGGTGPSGAGAGNSKTRRSVMIMTSGGEEPVQDDGGAGHSVFAGQLMSALESIDGDRMGAQIYHGVRTGIAQLAPQVPRYGGVVSAGHQIGTDYLFRAIARSTVVAATTDRLSAALGGKIPALAAMALVILAAAGGFAWRRSRRRPQHSPL